MTYAIKWHPQAYKVLRKLPKNIIERVLYKLDKIVEDPFRFLKHFEGRNLYKLRIGNYRALIEVNYEKRLLLIKVFDQRSKIYQK